MISKYISQYGRHELDSSDVNAVLEVLGSNFLTQGDKTNAFEVDIANFCGAGNCIVLNSATSALIAVMSALGVTANSRVWVPAISFVATANCAEILGAKLDFIDIDTSTFNIDLAELEQKLQSAEKIDQLPDVVIAVHMAGTPVLMEQLGILADRFGFVVVEDASHALGAEDKFGKIGNCKYSRATVFSFHPVKMITTAEGGAVVTNDDDLAERVRSYASHGVSRNGDEWRSLVPLSDYWSHAQMLIGQNYRMNEIQAALGISQLKKIDRFVKSRNRLSKIYERKFDLAGVEYQRVSCDQTSSRHLFIVNVNEASGFVKKSILNRAKTLKIGTAFHYPPIYLHPYYKQKYGYPIGYCKTAERYLAHAITLPLHTSLTEEDINFVTDKLFEIK